MVMRTVEMDFEFMNYIDSPPVTTDQQYKQACSNDNITVDSWRKQWVDNAGENHKNFGPFKENGIGQLFNKFKNRPCIVMGAGPDLKSNIDVHVEAQKAEIPIVSVLHNFHYCIDNGVHPDFFVSLDAGKVTIEEISEGGKLSHEEYVEKTKDFTLVAYIGSHPDLLKSWKGRILFFNCPIPHKGVLDEMNSVEQFHTYISSGGNVLGACTYLAKAIMGCNPICWTGASFSFSYDNKFHPWNSKYDGNLGKAIRAIDVFGNKRLTWQSYFNFNSWFQWLSRKVPGLYINATEGGILGAYPEGNIRNIMQITLSEFVRMYSMNESMRAQCEQPETCDNKILF